MLLRTTRLLSRPFKVLRRDLPQTSLKFLENTLTGPNRKIIGDGVATNQTICYNPPVPVLYELAMKFETNDTFITDTGALLAYSGAKTGRCPKDKRIVAEPTTEGEVWWGPVNMKLSASSFKANLNRALDYLERVPTLYVIDGYAGWDPSLRLKIRVVCSRAYHSLFMRNMLIRPSPEELKGFTPDFTIYNAGCFPADPDVQGLTSPTSISIDFAQKQMVILGSQYAGEMKKGVFTLMMHNMTKKNQLCLHSSANEGQDGRVSLFFGLSGTGKTTLSADPKRFLLGDDEHVWTDKGVFNIEGGCYAKCIGLRKENEPEIYDAIKFGSVVENAVVNDEMTVDFDSKKITENTRVSYPLEFIPNVKFPAQGGHPDNVVLLVCDAYGVLPPVSKLTPEQVMYQFVSGYTAKVAGTESGVTEPTPTFSACFGGPFLVYHPIVYAKMLAEKLKKHKAAAWLVNTGWVGGAAGSGGQRISLKYSRAIVDAINSGELQKGTFSTTMPSFNFEIPDKVKGVPDDLLVPWKQWKDQEGYNRTVNTLAQMFRENMNTFRDFDPAAVQQLMESEPKTVGTYVNQVFTKKFGLDG